MTGIENFTRAIEFTGPEYLPCTFKVDLDWLNEKDPAIQARIRELAAQFPDDIVHWLNAARNAVEPAQKDGIENWTDEWQTEWVDDGHGAKTEGYPLIDGYHVLDNYIFPEADCPDRFAAVNERLKARGDRYVQAAIWFTMFERLWMLRGYENLLMDPYLNEREFLSLRDKIVEFDLAMIDLWLERDVHAVFFSDDWGSQRGLLINPADWRKYYKPCYEKLFDRVRSGGAHVWMHMCGNITSILPDLIDIGLQVLNPVQPQAMDVGELAREFGGEVCFNGGVDVQGTLIHGTPDDVKREVHQLVDLLGRYKGGYIGDTSHSIMPETPLDNIIAMYEAFLECQDGA